MLLIVVLLVKYSYMQMTVKYLNILSSLDSMPLQDDVN